MYKIFAMFLLMNAATAFASDFRGLNFGESCAVIPELEAKHGSKPDDAYNNIYSFIDNYLNKEAIVYYSCDAGKFTVGKYIFKFNTMSEALDFYNTSKPKLIKIYGLPDIDTESEEVKENGIKLPKGMIKGIYWKFKKKTVQYVLDRLNSNNKEYIVITIDITSDENKI